MSKGKAGNRVGHSGGCPGYITNFVMVPKTKNAAIALTSAADGPAYRATNAMLETIGKAVKRASAKNTNKNKSKQENAEKEAPGKVALGSYSGDYGGTVWGGETLIRAWGDQLAVVRIPSDELKIAKLKHVEADTFVRLTDDGEEREPWIFQSDDDGEIVSLKIHGSVVPKLRGVD